VPALHAERRQALLSRSELALVDVAGRMAPYPQITVLAPELQQWLRFHPARIDRDPDRPMQVEVPVRNISDRQYLIDYRILFFDGDDMAVTPTMGWRFMAIEANQTARLTAGAMSPDAANYRLEIKWAR